MSDRGAPETRWQANECRLNEIHAMTGLGREIHATEAERLEGEQDRIEFELGRNAPEGSKRWSGLQ